MVWRYHFPIVHRCTICKHCVPNAIVTVSPLNQTLWLFISLFLLHNCYSRLAFYYRVAFILLAGQQISMSWLPTYLAAMYDHSMHYEAMRLTHCWADMVDTPLFGAMWQLQYTRILSVTLSNVWPVTNGSSVAVNGNSFYTLYLAAATLCSLIPRPCPAFHYSYYLWVAYISLSVSNYAAILRGQWLFKGGTWSRKCGNWLFLPKHTEEWS